MLISVRQLVLAASSLAISCGGTAPKTGDTATKASPVANQAPADPDTVYAPLEDKFQWSDWAKMNTEAFYSKSHGQRFVDVYVNSAAEAAFKNDDLDFPVGSVIIKSSWEVEDGKRTEVPGPVFLMEKRTEGFDPDNEDWWYGFHWESVPAKWAGRIGEQAYWRSPSKKVDYCGTCHEDFDRFVGGVDAEFRSY